MTAVALTPVRIDRTTVGGKDFDTIKSAASALGNSWANSGSQILVIRNASGGAKICTVNMGLGSKVDGVTPTARTYSVAAGKIRFIGPFPKASFNDASDLVSISFDSVTSVEVAVITVVPE